jgi:predicted translin family RNA/ssDNA-binding protein
MIEIFDDNGRPKTVEKTDMFGNKYIDIVEKVYKKGHLINIPEDRVEKLGKKVERMTPKIEEMKRKPGKKLVKKVESKEKPKTVGELIPKD